MHNNSVAVGSVTLGIGCINIMKWWNLHYGCWDLETNQSVALHVELGSSHPNTPLSANIRQLIIIFRSAIDRH